MKILRGDSFTILPTLGDKSFDVVISDPPYDFTADQMDELTQQFMRISRTGYIVFSPPENQWIPKPNQYGFWVKPISTKNTSRRYSRFVEMIQFYGNLKWNPDRHWSQYTNVFTDIVEGRSDHPYEKPLSLMRRLIENHTDIGDSVLDPFCGSGTTGIAAESVGRVFTGIEREVKELERKINP